MPFALASTSQQEEIGGAKNRMSEVGKFVERLMAAGCIPKVAAEVVTEAIAAGMSMAPSRDPAAEKRRAWDREYRRKRKEKSGGTGGNRVEKDAIHVLWTEGVGLLRQLGIAEKKARSNVGLWLKSHQPERVLDVIREAARARAIDAIPWITTALGGTNGKQRRTASAAADDLIARAERIESEGGFGPIVEAE